MSMFPFPSAMLLGGQPLVTAWNASNPQGYATVSGAIATATYVNPSSSSTGQMASATIGTRRKSSGKWYFEVTLAGAAATAVGQQVGIQPQINTNASDIYHVGGIGAGIGIGSQINAAPASGQVLCDDLNYNFNGFPRFSSGSTISVAVDLDNLLIWFGVNGQFYGWNPFAYGRPAGDPTSGTYGITIPPASYYPAYQSVAQGTGTYSQTATLNTKGGFKYTPPPGFAPWG
jgi:hypothetical protein